MLKQFLRGKNHNVHPAYQQPPQSSFPAQLFFHLKIFFDKNRLEASPRLQVHPWTFILLLESNLNIMIP